MAAGISAGVAFIDILPNMASFSAGIGAGMRKAGTQLMSLGSRLTRILTIPILGVAAASVKMGLDFQRSSELIKTQAGASQAEVDRMRKAMLNLAPKVGTGPQALSQALFHVESVGFRGAKALDVLKTSAMGAKVGLSDIEDTASALAGVLVTNIKGTGNLQNAMGTLNAIVGAGNMHMQDLVASLKSGIVPTAKIAGLSLQGLGAAMAMMTDEGIPAGIAANRLRTSLFMMTNPTAKALTALKSIGLHAKSLGHDLQQPDGLNVAMEDLKKHMEDIKDPTQRLALIGAMFGGSRSAGTVAMLLNNLSRIKLKYDQIGKTAGNYAKQVDSTRHTAQFKLDQAWAAIQADLIRLSVQLIPIALQLAGAFTHVAEAFGNLSPMAQKFIVYGALIAAAVGPLVFTFGAIATVVGTAASAFGILGGIIVILAGTLPGFTVAMTDAGISVVAFGGALDVTVPELGLLAIGIGAVTIAAGIVAGALGLGADKTNQLADATKRASDAVHGLNDALTEGNSAHHNLIEARHAETAAGHQVEAAQKAVNKLVKDGKKGSLDYKEALDNLHSAQDGYYNATQRTAAAQQANNKASKARTKAIRDDHAATANLIGTYNKQAAANLKVAHASDNTRFAGIAMGDALKKNATDLKAVQKQLEANAQAHLHNANVQASKGNPAMAATERHLALVDKTALQLSKHMDGMPTFHHIEVQMEINARAKLTESINQTISRNFTHDQGTGIGPQSTGPAPPKKKKHHSIGGNMAAGEAGYVGEMGPELFVPDVSGHIIPNRDLTHVTGGGSGKHAIVITNWDEGIGYIEKVADTSVARGRQHTRQIARMSR